MDEHGVISLTPKYLIVEWGAQEKQENTEIHFLMFSESAIGRIWDLDLLTL